MAYSQIGVVGAGIMGEALIVTLLRGGVDAKSISIVEKKADRKREVEEKYQVSSAPLAECEVVFLLVKPQDLDSTLSEFKSEIKSDALIVSFVAGKSTASIEGKLSSTQRVIRVMPNTPMTSGKGFCGMSGGKFAGPEDLAWVEKMLSSSSLVIVVPEDQQDAVTALSGSGPAYFFLMVEAMAEAGKKLGLSESDALRAAKEVLIGAAAMVEKSGKDPKTLRENVTSPNGTTFAALTTFNSEGFDEVVYRAMKAARDRSVELSS